jgi:hypothetical protein
MPWQPQGSIWQPQEDEDGNLSELTCTISMGGIWARLPGGGFGTDVFRYYGMGTTNKTIRVAGYNGTQEFSGDSGTLTVQVRRKISVIIEWEAISKNPRS